MARKASFIHGKPNVEKLERAARDLLGYPCLPDGANGPRGRAILAQIQADEKRLAVRGLGGRAGLGTAPVRDLYLSRITAITQTADVADRVYWFGWTTTEYGV